ncbi:MAG: C-GCAxxG-C-C family protein [Peptoniphilus sp.]|nr:C-GCAxxG-C-C family protein [Peptoniphilus sp.]MDY3118458.1 C-GCAxxG-C-C family protein [Peptoniphilus sp.]
MENKKNCAQVVLSTFSKAYGVSKETAEALAAPFGSGRYRGETCGCVNAATMVLGLAYKDDPVLLEEKVKAFDDAFRTSNGSVYCRTILGHDFSKPGEMDAAFTDGSIETYCPRCIASSIAIVESLLKNSH